ncbi:hypothetical protein H1D31_00025 [Alishewanella sp. BS5-314]|uniref:hypothetical protein n=1 Tax=Alishewanella sp. BS5-314 TaxID=2755587 RepID=UPI0021BA53DA|nr:hypothetical protein [Alishewanella sp. BS5-314]MCT8124423.1 hypothetical protein [Alishewanella sp. BS5-314]
MFFRSALLPPEPQVIAFLTVKTQVSSAPARKRIVVVDRETQELLWHSFVENNGEITRRLPPAYASTRYLCVKAYDDTMTYNAVVADFVQAELMPE